MPPGGVVAGPDEAVACPTCGQEGYAGSGAPDPEPLRGLSNAEIVRRASQAGDVSFERATAVVSAARRHLPEAIGLIEAALAEPHQGIRLIGVSALIERGGADSLGVLWRVAKGDPDPLVRGSAVFGISRWGAAQIRKLIEYGWSQNDPVVLGAVILQTRLLGDDPSVWPVLERAIAHPDQRVWQEAMYVAATIGGRRAVEFLKKDLEKGSSDPKRRAALEFYLQQAHRNAWKEERF